MVRNDKLVPTNCQVAMTRTRVYNTDPVENISVNRFTSKTTSPRFEVLLRSEGYLTELTLKKEETEPSGKNLEEVVKFLPALWTEALIR